MADLQSTVKPFSILSFARDLPNLCSLTGLLFSVIAIYFAVLGMFPVAMIALIWSVFFDWSDGIIARRIKGRTIQEREFGAQLDSLIDLVGFGIAPAIVLLSYGDWNPWFLPGAFIVVAASVLRLSYFNVFGLVSSSSYMGLALDNNVILLTFFFLFESFVDQEAFAMALYVLLVTLAVLNVAPIRTPKLAGRWYYGLIGYCLTTSGLYIWLVLSKTTPL